ncbi:hypothetical protein, partial [Azorhizobium sp. AG788]|uniref:hypothetical protein n=1 Tax=Azorhizobium sp. AG788 TaxID=2183897 RepID=UPI001AAE193C
RARLQASGTGRYRAAGAANIKCAQQAHNALDSSRTTQEGQVNATRHIKVGTDGRRLRLEDFFDLAGVYMDAPVDPLG